LYAVAEAVTTAQATPGKVPARRKREAGQSDDEGPWGMLSRCLAAGKGPKSFFPACGRGVNSLGIRTLKHVNFSWIAGKQAFVKKPSESSFEESYPHEHLIETKLSTN